MVSAVSALLLLFGFFTGTLSPRPIPAEDTIRVKFTEDFPLSGEGNAAAWKAASWNMMPQRDKGSRKETKFKTLYSATGIYFLFACQDEKLTATFQADFEKLWMEDVVEVFLWPDPSHPLYFEYELSPLNYELPILVPNMDGRFFGWRPWQYEGQRKSRHQTSVSGGKKESGSPIKSWQAEFYLPYALLAPLANVPPTSGTVWKANMYRIDYDHPETGIWSWQKTDKNFHEFKKFGNLIFE